MRNLAAFYLLLIGNFCFAQNDTLPPHLNKEDLIESFLQEQDSDAEFDYNDLFEELDYLYQKPLKLNDISPSDLDLFPFLSPIQKTALLEYLDSLGPLVSIFELQAVPYFDLATIRKLLPFVQIEQANFDPLPNRWKTDGSSQLIMRWSRTLEEKKGFIKKENGESPYQGDRNALYIRYRFSYSDRLSFGFTAEKDEGETIFSKSNKKGFDFYSAHFFMYNPSGRIKSLAIGDYSVSMGQGLILFNGFSVRKGPQTTQVKRSSKPLKRYSSVNESDFFRGAAATLALNEKLDFTTFFSSKKQDANFESLNETVEDTPLVNFVTSLQNTGKHRTDSEIADEKAIRQSAAGSILKWQERKWHLAWNTLFNSLNQPLNRNPALYNQFYFNGNRLFNTSFDYSYTWHNFHFFGETAISGNGASATTNGLLASLDQKMDVSVLYRRFPKNYQALNAQPFSETSGARNETGVYLGMEIRPIKEWTVNAYFDQWQNPWLRYRVDAPGKGHEWLLRVTWEKRRKMAAHFQIKNEVKPENEDAEDGRFDQIYDRQNFQGRIHLSYRLNKNLEWRSRVYAGFSKINREKLTGTALFQDLKYSSPSSGFSFSIRYAIFDTDDYVIRFYAYENDVLNSFTVPAYYDRGSRFYLLMGYKIRGGILLQGRIARTAYANRETVGSGQDEINGPVKTDVKVQLRWNF